jgi:phosphate transport system protein
MVRIDTELALFQDSILQMSEKVRRMYTMALEVLESGNKERSLAIIELDEFVNNNEEEINDRGLEVLSLLAPVASDLRIIIAGIKIASDLERIGDYAKNIARYVIKNEAIDGELLNHAQKIGQKFIDLFDKAIECYVKKDAKTAIEVPQLDDEIDAAFEISMERGENVPHLVATVGMLRNIERAGDHTKNICEHLIYQVKGQHYDFG